MKRLVLIALIALIGHTVQAQAKISFKAETIDYGKIAKGSDGVRVFEFTNTGDADLVIADVKSSCGCTVPKKPEGPIAPGASSTIQVKYDTNRVGPIRKTVTVYSNADQAIKALKIKGEVLAEGKSVLEKTK
ncbi:MAG: DUF1573 domain-containing protein [Bacteroidia bacterium]|nr:DUF1573 domain-containing protein [Bacteroidia bacterium]NNF30376.1 DUF1573 domain-containing protein [Flavobacteriaceae bacterium]MBT8276452.1 DUF1573 domain-containing protein [Bacteroidia bacterium]NNJ81162.1 DUF1573 domain-containing protein [Flavobacteriaceae bacterium]NNK53479.1 DUF1573 domain-containing protein [Flavobacteriaceae bacterium]